MSLETDSGTDKKITSAENVVANAFNEILSSQKLLINPNKDYQKYSENQTNLANQGFPTDTAFTFVEQVGETSVAKQGNRVVELSNKDGTYDKSSDSAGTWTSKLDRSSLSWNGDQFEATSNTGDVTNIDKKKQTVTSIENGMVIVQHAQKGMSASNDGSINLGLDESGSAVLENNTNGVQIKIDASGVHINKDGKSFSLKNGELRDENGKVIDQKDLIPEWLRKSKVEQTKAKTIVVLADGSTTLELETDGTTKLTTAQGDTKVISKSGVATVTDASGKLQAFADFKSGTVGNSEIQVGANNEVRFGDMLLNGNTLTSMSAIQLSDALKQNSAEYNTTASQVSSFTTNAVSIASKGFKTQKDLADLNNSYSELTKILTLRLSLGLPIDDVINAIGSVDSATKTVQEAINKPNAFASQRAFVSA